MSLTNPGLQAIRNQGNRMGDSAIESNQPRPASNPQQRKLMAILVTGV